MESDLRAVGENVNADTICWRVTHKFYKTLTFILENGFERHVWEIATRIRACWWRLVHSKRLKTAWALRFPLLRMWWPFEYINQWIYQKVLYFQVHSQQDGPSHNVYELHGEPGYYSLRNGLSKASSRKTSHALAQKFHTAYWLQA